MPTLDAGLRKHRQRATVLVLFALIALSVYTILIAPPSLAPVLLPTAGASARRRFPAHAFATRHRAPGPAPPPPPPLQLTPAQELGALTSLLAGLSQAVLPPGVDPAHPLDPQLVLDFDTRAPGAPAELAGVVGDAWRRNPVVLFSKLHSPLAREVKSMLAEMNLRPAPTIFEVDQRADADVLTPVLQRLTGAGALPILLIGGAHAGPIERLRTLHTSGELRTMVSTAGAVVDGAHKKKKKH